MDTPEHESGAPEEPDPLRAYALQNAARVATKPRSSMVPFLISVLVTAVILAIAYYLWGQ
jgi:hypothetical protein